MISLSRCASPLHTAKAKAELTSCFAVVQNAASGLERQINRWAADVTRAPPAPPNVLRHAALADAFDDEPEELSYSQNATGIQIQSLLRHAVSKTIAEGIVNCLIVTDSPEANIQLTRIHEHIFSRA